MSTSEGGMYGSPEQSRQSPAPRNLSGLQFCTPPPLPLNMARGTPQASRPLSTPGGDLILETTPPSFWNSTCSSQGGCCQNNSAGEPPLSSQGTTGGGNEGPSGTSAQGASPQGIPPQANSPQGVSPQSPYTSSADASAESNSESSPASNRVERSLRETPANMRNNNTNNNSSSQSGGSRASPYCSSAPAAQSFRGSPSSPEGPSGSSRTTTLGTLNRNLTLEELDRSGQYVSPSAPLNVQPLRRRNIPEDFYYAQSTPARPVPDRARPIRGFYNISPVAPTPEGPPHYPGYSFLNETRMRQRNVSDFNDPDRDRPENLSMNIPVTNAPRYRLDPFPEEYIMVTPPPPAAATAGRRLQFSPNLSQCEPRDFRHAPGGRPLTAPPAYNSVDPRVANGASSAPLRSRTPPPGSAGASAPGPGTIAGGQGARCEVQRLAEGGGIPRPPPMPPLPIPPPPPMPPSAANNGSGPRQGPAAMGGGGSPGGDSSGSGIPGSTPNSSSGNETFLGTHQQEVSPGGSPGNNSILSAQARASPGNVVVPQSPTPSPEGSPENSGPRRPEARAMSQGLPGPADYGSAGGVGPNLPRLGAVPPPRQFSAIVSSPSGSMGQAAGPRNLGPSAMDIMTACFELLLRRVMITSLVPVVNELIQGGNWPWRFCDCAGENLGGLPSPIIQSTPMGGGPGRDPNISGRRQTPQRRLYFGSGESDVTYGGSYGFLDGSGGNLGLFPPPSLFEEQRLLIQRGARANEENSGGGAAPNSVDRVAGQAANQLPNPEGTPVAVGVAQQSPVAAQSSGFGQQSPPGVGQQSPPGVGQQSPPGVGQQSPLGVAPPGVAQQACGGGYSFLDQSADLPSFPGHAEQQLEQQQRFSPGPLMHVSMVNAALPGGGSGEARRREDLNNFNNTSYASGNNFTRGGSTQQQQQQYQQQPGMDQQSGNVTSSYASETPAEMTRGGPLGGQGTGPLMSSPATAGPSGRGVQVSPIPPPPGQRLMQEFESPAAGLPGGGQCGRAERVADVSGISGWSSFNQTPVANRNLNGLSYY